MSMLRPIVTALLLFYLAGCSVIGPRQVLDGSGNAQAWQQHQASLQHLDNWQISGKVGIRAADNSGSASLFWLQQQGGYDIRLSGPLGRGAARLTGVQGLARLEVANQGQFQASDPETLLQQQLGWHLPVDNLLWWIRGLPAPNGKRHLTLDEGSRLARLEQDGWRIDYTRYAEHGGYWLPERLRLEGPNLQVTLVVKEWLPR